MSTMQKHTCIYENKMLSITWFVSVYPTQHPAFGARHSSGSVSGSLQRHGHVQRALQKEG